MVGSQGRARYLPGCFTGVNITRVFSMRYLTIRVLLVAFGTTSVLPAQTPPAKPPTVGSVSPQAIGRPLQQPAPIGGLRTTPIGSERPGSAPEKPRLRGHPFGGHFVPLRVVDAPLLRGGAVVLTEPQSPFARATWIPTADRPRWHVDSLAPRVDAWRDLIVADIVCDGAGTCIERRSRVRARWSAYCSCYLFADALNRVWRVE